MLLKMPLRLKNLKQDVKFEIHSNFKYEFTEEEYQASLVEFLERKING